MGCGRQPTPSLFVLFVVKKFLVNSNWGFQAETLGDTHYLRVAQSQGQGIRRIIRQVVDLNFQELRHQQGDLLFAGIAKTADDLFDSARSIFIDGDLRFSEDAKHGTARSAKDNRCAHIFAIESALDNCQVGIITGQQPLDAGIQAAKAVAEEEIGLVQDHSAVNRGETVAARVNQSPACFPQGSVNAKNTKLPGGKRLFLSLQLREFLAIASRQRKRLFLTCSGLRSARIASMWAFLFRRIRTKLWCLYKALSLVDSTPQAWS